ncbi:hypothetical protein PQ469_31245 [Mucilaginibacter sp. KACC 22773]|uniref:DUF7716 domain-containing protein n=1 Tax=Mucilaginibacter sp. KACC 22773 TaxID=3025671 RepID=UPI0023663E02|nr:hypothetical protein [Mucilaginibacter sp. KACC 22773]WDF78366.1 hypothetical protein PQ469_31245 [Mucilaginibacter sp. KACC 22773]
MKFITTGTLENIIHNIHEFDDLAVLFVDQKLKWGPLSKTCIYFFEDGEEVPSKIDDIPYFLEVELVKEVIDVWNIRTTGKRQGSKDIIDAVIFYAERDAYMPASGNEDR